MLHNLISAIISLFLSLARAVLCCREQQNYERDNACYEKLEKFWICGFGWKIKWMKCSNILNGFVHNVRFCCWMYFFLLRFFVFVLFLSLVFFLFLFCFWFHCENSIKKNDWAAQCWKFDANQKLWCAFMLQIHSHFPDDEKSIVAINGRFVI